MAQAPRFFDLPARVRTKTICGRNAAAVRKAASRFGSILCEKPLALDAAECEEMLAAGAQITRRAHGLSQVQADSGDLSREETIKRGELGNRIYHYRARQPEGRRGFREIIVTEPEHPFMNSWWPPGHISGYEPPSCT